MDLDRIFPMQDEPSARLMKLKAFCLSRAGVLSAEEEAEVRARAAALIRDDERFRAALPPRRAA
jgi:hypothetical protein